MKDIRLIWIASFLAMTISISVEAQKKTLTFQDLIPGGSTNYQFMPQSIRQLQWCGEAYIYVKGDSLWTALPAEKEERVGLTLKRLNEALRSSGLPEAESMPGFFVPDNNKTELAFRYKNYRVHYDLTADKIVTYYTMDTGGSRWEYDKAKGHIAFTKENNIYILTCDGTTETVTAETDKGIVCGTSVHQNEFGIHKGLFWSPAGNALAFYRMDETMVTDYPLINISARIAKTEPFKYPMAGMKSHEVTVGIYRLSDRRTVWLQTGISKETFLTNIAWSPDEKSIYIAELNRGQDTCRLVRYNAETGAREAELFVETNARYVEPQQPILFIPDNPQQFIWHSQRDGFNHLYLYNTEGKQLKQLTTGRWVVKETLGFDRKSRNLFFTATASRYNTSLDEEENPLETYLWKLDMKTGKQQCMNPKAGVHSVNIHPSGAYMIDYTSSPEIPRDIDIVNLKDGRIVKSLLKANNPYEDYELPTVKIGTLKAADDETTLYYRLTTPPNMDESKKYPVIIHVYGGPHAQLVTGGWMNATGGWDLYMASQGYIMFTIDGRGSANRGFAFESIIHRHLGEVEMTDQLKGVEFLKTLPYVDKNRIGVHGWSYGGFMTTNLMLTYPEVFKVGVAGGAVIDWQRYEIMYGERYMDHPQENPEGYENSNLLNKAGHLKGRLLLIHGDMDPVVVWQHSLLFIKACVDAGTFPDYFVYPGHGHGVGGKDRLHLSEIITRYFIENL